MSGILRSSDVIEKKIVLRTPIDHVWNAIAQADNFGAWFGVRFDGPFVAGKRLFGKIAPTAVDEKVAATQKPYEGARFEILVVELAPKHLFSFRWHPFAVDATVDYSKDPMTLVEFFLQEVKDGTELVIRESGFDALPPARRFEAFKANDGGWSAQTSLIEKYLAR